jgi:thioesterase domain-containing protein
VLADFASYLEAEHADGLARVLGLEPAKAEREESGRIDAAAVERLSALLARPVVRRGPAGERNPPALFLISPPRSGSTLLRVMLAGHPRLFAPPELELLAFETMAERRQAFAGRDAYRVEGAIRALMEARGEGVEEARREIEACEREAMPVERFYRLLQEAIGDRLLVDKTASYAWDPATLRRAEDLFDGPRYLHLIRHPAGTIHSFEEAKLDQIYFAGLDSLPRRALAELSWVIGHRRILELAAEVPAERFLTVHFETLVAEPRRVMEEICSFLGLPFNPAMLSPYEARSARMTDGLHAESRMLGDVKFHQHSRIEAGVAERWRESLSEESLSGVTLRLAEELGVELDTTRRSRPGPLVGIQQGSPSRQPLFLVHPVFGDALFYRHLADALGPEQPVYAFDAIGHGAGAEPLSRIEDLAERYLAALRRARPRGPYRLGGGSMGGTVAYEMAQRLIEEGEEVDLLALIDTWDASGLTLPRPDPIEDELLVLAYFAGPQPEETLAALRRLGREERAAAILERSRAAGALAPGYGLGDMKRLFATISANREAMWSYRPRPYPGSILYLRASEGRPADLDPVPAWQRLCSGGVAVHDVPGDHHTMLMPPHVGALARVLAAYLGGTSWPASPGVGRSQRSRGSAPVPDRPYQALRGAR